MYRSPFHSHRRRERKVVFRLYQSTIRPIQKSYLIKSRQNKKPRCVFYHALLLYLLHTRTLFYRIAYPYSTCLLPILLPQSPLIQDILLIRCLQVLSICGDCKYYRLIINICVLFVTNLPYLAIIYLQNLNILIPKALATILWLWQPFCWDTYVLEVDQIPKSS